MYTAIENLTHRLEEEGLSIFQNIVENSIDAILMTNSQFRIAYANHACNQLIGRNTIGLSLASLWPEADYPLLDAITELAQIGGFFSAARLNGFWQVTEQFPGIEIVGTLAADWDREKGRLAAEKFLRANPPGTLDIIWAASGEMALGALMAVETAGRQDEVKIFSNDVTPESADRVREGRLMAETHHGFADWGWYGAKFAVMLALGLDVPPRFDIRPRTMYKENADFFYPNPVLEPIDWVAMKAGRTLPKKIVIGWIQAAYTGVYQTATDYFEKAAAEARGHGINVEVITRVPVTDTDFAGQAAIIDDYIQRQVDVIALSTVKLEVVKQALNRAQAAGIPVIIVNQLEAIEGVDVASYIGFDNTKAGTVSGYAVVNYLGGPGVLGRGEPVELQPETELDLAWWQVLYRDVVPERMNVRGRVAIIEGISGNWSGENRLIRSDRNLIDVDTITYPVRSKTGELIGLVAAFRDATQRKQAERTLIEQEQRIRSLYEVTTFTAADDATQFQTLLMVGTRLLDLELGIISQIEGDVYTILYFDSPTEHLKQGQTFPLGTTYCDITYRANDVVTIDHMSQSRYQNHPCYKAFNLEAYIGTPLWVNMKRFGTLVFASTRPRTEPFTQADKNFVRLMSQWVSTAFERQIDRAALAQARDEALAASQFKSQLMAKVSHELRTPLGSILGYTQFLKDGAYGPISPKQKEITQKVIESTDYLTQLVNELLDQVQLATGKAQLNLEKFASRDLVNPVKVRMQILADNKGLDLTIKIAKYFPETLFGDRKRLEQILTNLICAKIL